MRYLFVLSLLLFVGCGKTDKTTYSFPNYSVSFPKEWRTLEEKNKHSIAENDNPREQHCWFLLKEPGKSEILAWTVIWVEKNAQPLSQANWEKERKELLENCPPNTTVIVEKTKTTVNGKPACYIEIKGPREEKELHGLVYCLEISDQKGTRIAYILFSTEEAQFNAMRPTFEEIVKSFQTK